MRPAEDSEKDGGRTSTTDRRIAYALLRIVFGVNIFFHGLSRLLGDHAAFLAYLSQQMAKAPIPKSLLPPFAAALPWVEATIGLLLLLGLFPIRAGGGLARDDRADGRHHAGGELGRSRHPAGLLRDLLRAADASRPKLLFARHADCEASFSHEDKIQQRACLSAPKPTSNFRLWLKKLDRLNSEPFMKHGREQPRPQRRRRMFRDPPARHEPKMTSRAPLMVPRASYTVFTLLITCAGLCSVSDSGGPDSALSIPSPYRSCSWLSATISRPPLRRSPIGNGIIRSAHDDDDDGIQAHSGRGRQRHLAHCPHKYSAPSLDICGEAVEWRRRAIEKAWELKPDLVLLDVAMPRSERHRRRVSPERDDARGLCRPIHNVFRRDRPSLPARWPRRRLVVPAKATACRSWPTAFKPCWHSFILFCSAFAPALGSRHSCHPEPACRRQAQRAVGSIFEVVLSCRSRLPCMAEPPYLSSRLPEVRKGAARDLQCL